MLKTPCLTLAAPTFAALAFAATLAVPLAAAVAQVPAPAAPPAAGTDDPSARIPTATADPVQASPNNPAFLTGDQVNTILRVRGYSDVSGVVQEGDTFRIPEATRYGAKVQNLRIDALTGQPREQANLTEAQAIALLRDRGYSDVSEVGREGDTIRLRGVRDGTPVELRVDARTGAVRQ